MITVHIAEACSPFEVSQSRLEQLVVSICERFAVTDALVSLSLTGHEQMTRYNREFLDHEGSTDCISFDLSDGAEQVKVFEVIVNAELALEEARRRNHGPEAELALYVTHGMLHNLGFDDLDEAPAREMHRLEDAILEGFGYGVVYDGAKRSEGPD